MDGIKELYFMIWTMSIILVLQTLEFISNRHCGVGIRPCECMMIHTIGGLATCIYRRMWTHLLAVNHAKKVIRCLQTLLARCL